MDAEQSARLFEAFKPGRRLSTTRRYGGTGWPGDLAEEPGRDDGRPAVGSSASKARLDLPLPARFGVQKIPPYRMFYADELRGLVVDDNASAREILPA